MVLEDIGNLVAQVGFPVAVAGFLLWRLNGKVESMTKALDALTRLNRATLRHTLHQHRRERGLEPDEETILSDLENGGL